MSDEVTEKPNRINQWFIRGLGISISGLFVFVMFFTLYDLDNSLFKQDLPPSLDFNYIIIAKKMGEYLWTFRVYDLLLVLILILLASIASYYIISYKSTIKSKNKIQQRRYQF